MPLEIVVNGEARTVAADPMTPLAEVLRDSLSLTGTKLACEEGFCGSCTVLLDDRPAMACLMPVALAAGRRVRTVESLAPADAALSPLQAAMESHDAVQCGMCFPGMLMSLTALFERQPAPSRAEILAALDGNICRCTGYERIVEAALSLGGAAAAEISA